MPIKFIANRYTLHLWCKLILLPICKIILTRKLFICNILRWYSLQCHDQDNVIIDNQICLVWKLHEHLIKLFVNYKIVNGIKGISHVVEIDFWSIHISFIVTPASFLYSSVSDMIHVCIQKSLACRGKEGFNIEKG